MSKTTNRRPGSAGRLALAVLLAGLAGLAGGAAASAQLRCEITQAGETQSRDFLPTADPYLVRAIDINGHFRFKAVVVGDGQRLDYVKLYTYYEGRRQPVLLHQATYRAPAAGPLTGTQRLYSPRLERELQYACAVVEAGR
jgi:hypothetical protein